MVLAKEIPSSSSLSSGGATIFASFARPSMIDSKVGDDVQQDKAISDVSQAKQSLRDKSTTASDRTVGGSSLAGGWLG